MDGLRRFLELVQRELHADDVRFEVGLHTPENALVHVLPSGFRLVVVGSTALGSDDERQQRLAMLAETFAETLGAAAELAPHPPASAAVANHALDETLAALARIANAIAAIVVDERSPMIWGSSVEPREPVDADVAAWVTSAAAAAMRGGLDLADILAADTQAKAEMLARLGPDDQARVQRALARFQQLTLARPHDDVATVRRFVATMRAIAGARRGPADARVVPSEHDRLGWLARGFAGIYRLVMVFDGPYSELHAEAAAIRALPVIERLVAGLPPFDPPKSGQIVRLFPPK